MNCPRCGKPLPGGAAFCMHCGQMLAGTPQPVVPHAVAPQGYAPAAVAIPSEVRRRNTILAVAISAVLLLLLFFGLRAAGVLGVRGKPDDTAALAAKGMGPDPTLQARAKGSDPSLGARRVTMPDDIRNWLAHLQKCEIRKRAIDAKQQEQLTDEIMQDKQSGGMTLDDVNFWSSPDATKLPVVERVDSIVRDMKPAWRELKTYFDSYPPPPECKQLAQAFDGGLEGISDQLDQFDTIISSVASPTEEQQGKDARDKVRDIGRSHRATVDEPFSEADRLLGEVCDKYQTQKWFSIDAHGQSKSPLGF